MALVIWWLFLGFFVGCLAIIWWALFVDHDLTEEPYDDEGDKGESLLAGMDGVSFLERYF